MTTRTTIIATGTTLTTLTKQTPLTPGSTPGSHADSQGRSAQATRRCGTSQGSTTLWPLLRDVALPVGRLRLKSNAGYQACCWNAVATRGAPTSHQAWPRDYRYCLGQPRTRHTGGEKRVKEAVAPGGPNPAAVCSAPSRVSVGVPTHGGPPPEPSGTERCPSPGSDHTTTSKL